MKETLRSSHPWDPSSQEAGAGGARVPGLTEPQETEQKSQAQWYMRLIPALGRQKRAWPTDEFQDSQGHPERPCLKLWARTSEMTQQVKVFVTRLKDLNQNLVTHMTGRTDSLKWSSELRTRTVAHNK